MRGELENGGMDGAAHFLRDRLFRDCARFIEAVEAFIGIGDILVCVSVLLGSMRMASLELAKAFSCCPIAA